MDIGEIWTYIIYIHIYIYVRYVPLHFSPWLNDAKGVDFTPNPYVIASSKGHKK